MLSRIKFEIEPLVAEILDKLPESHWTSTTTTFLDPAIGGGQFVIAIEHRLRAYGHSDDNIRSRVFGFEESDLHIRFAVNKYKLVGQYTKVPYEKFFEMENSMKFDVVIGNPPFSKPKEGKTAGKRAEELYTKFFVKALSIAPIVAMVMPTTNTKVQEKHNNLLKEKANELVFVENGVFNVSMPMWYVIVDGSDRTPDVKFTIDTTGNDIEWFKGNVNMTGYKEITGHHGLAEPSATTDVVIYHKLNSKEGLIKKYGHRSEFKSFDFFPKSGYAVLMPQTITDKGWSVTEIIECTGNQVAFNGMNIVFCATHDQATRLVNYMQTESFVSQANKVKQGFNNMNLSCLKSIVISKEEVDAIFN